MMDSAPTPLGVVMLSSKFSAASDMGGGVERSARRLIAFLTGAGHRVTVLTRNYDGLPRRGVLEGAAIERFPVWGRGRVPASVSYLLQSLWWLIRHRRGYDVVHCHQSYAPALIGGLAKLLLRKPVIVKVSTADVFSERKELERLPLFPLRRFLLRRMDRLIAVNPSALDEFGDLGIPPQRMIHIPNGVPVPTQPAYLPEVNAAARKRLGLPDGKLAVFVGRLSSEKNLHVLLASWPIVLRRYPDATLVLVGDGGTFRNVEASLREQVRGLGLEDRIRFAGRVSDVTDFLLAAEAFVLPSKTEGMSNALLEAMAHGLPAIATRVPGNARLIRHEENGLLVEPGDPRALAAAIVRIFDTPADAQRMARAARQTVSERFTIHQVGQAYLEVYAQLLTKAGHG